MNFIKSVFFIFLLSPIVSFGQDNLINYRGEVECEYITINDTLRLSCKLITHPDYIDYLDEEEEYQSVSSGMFKKMDKQLVLWNGTYRIVNTKDHTEVEKVFENGILISE